MSEDLNKIVGKLYIEVRNLKRDNKGLLEQQAKYIAQIQYLTNMLAAKEAEKIIPKHARASIVDGRPHCLCGSPGVRNEQSSAYYCAIGNVWLESTCATGECKYCFNVCEFCEESKTSRDSNARYEMPPSTLKLKEMEKAPSTQRMRDEEKAPETLRSIPSHPISEKPITISMR
jgi:hypothetical protein